MSISFNKTLIPFRHELSRIEEEVKEENIHALMAWAKCNLETVFKFFHTKNLNSIRATFVQNHLLTTNQKKTIQFKGVTFVLKHSIIKSKENLGKGYSGRLYKIGYLSLETFEISYLARKVMRTHKDKLDTESAKLQVINECRVLKIIHEKAIEMNESALLSGFQHFPSRIGSKCVNNISAIFFDGPLYLCDAFSFFINDKLKIQQKSFWTGCNFLIQGVAFLQKIEIIHVDIKLENIFVDKDESGNILLRLGDFGGAKLSTEIDRDSDNSFIFTSEITPSSEIPYYRRSNDELFALSTFQLGASLYHALSKGSDPYELCYSEDEDDEDQYLDTKNSVFYEHDLTKQTINQELIHFIKKLLHKRFDRRPTGQNLEKLWKETKSKVSFLRQMEN